MPQSTAKSRRVSVHEALPIGNQYLSVDQQRAIQYLLAGHTVSETAALISKSRDTVGRWRSNPHFVAEMNRQQQDLLQSINDRLVKLSHKAVDVLEHHLEANSLKAATELLKMSGAQQRLSVLSAETNSDMVAKRMAEDLANEIFLAEPFATKRQPGEFQKGMAKDIHENLRKQYNIESRLHQLSTAVPNKEDD